MGPPRRMCCPGAARETPAGCARRRFKMVQSPETTKYSLSAGLPSLQMRCPVVNCFDFVTVATGLSSVRVRSVCTECNSCSTSSLLKPSAMMRP